MISSIEARVKYLAIASMLGVLAPFIASPQAKAIDLSNNFEAETRWLYTTTGNPSDYIVNPGTGYDGVADLSLQGFRCSGALLPTGAHILTAAHCLTDEFGNQDVFSGTATFELLTGDTSLAIENIFIHEDWTASFFGGNDIAILELEAIAPEAAERFDIYREAGEVGRVGDKVGYGRSGNGNDGDVLSSGTKRAGQNRYDSTGVLFGSIEELLAYDFDNGLAENDAFGFFFGNTYADLGLGLNEVSAAPGDSGGPTFIDGEIAGISSFGSRFFFPSTGASSDIDNELNASFGEFGFDTRVSSHSDWIDEILDAWDDPNGGPASVPEPSELAGLMALGAGLLLRRRKINSSRSEI